MKVRFWGTRGSMPAIIGAQAIERKVTRAIATSINALLRSPAGASAAGDGSGTAALAPLPFAQRATYGSCTSCVEIIAGSPEFVLLDAGTGLRVFGDWFLENHPGQHGVFHIFLSHLHWDHIQGFPFFMPAYLPGHVIHFYGGHAEIESALVGQQAPPWFPVPFARLPAEIHFHLLEPGRAYKAAGLTVTLREQEHPGRSYGYSFFGHGRRVVYSTDCEHKAEEGVITSPYLEFFAGADLLIFDAQYSLAEAEVMKRDWGHSSNMIGIELAVHAAVKRLAFFHSDPARGDEELDEALARSRDYARLFAPDWPLEVIQAYDGLEIDLEEKAVSCQPSAAG